MDELALKAAWQEGAGDLDDLAFGAAGDLRLTQKVRDEMQRRMHQYSKVDRDLRELFKFMSLRGALELEHQSHVGRLTRDAELQRCIDAISSDLRSKFEFLQCSTARQVLLRCLKNVEHVDAATEMEEGQDPLEALIESLKSKLSQLDMEVDSVNFEKIEI